MSVPDPLTGPAFGSYSANDVEWLLQDLSSASLERPVEEREEAMQSGAGHYAESLPIEYQPSDAYKALFRSALDESALRLAVAVGRVTELVLAERGPDAVLVSLARAGTPVGILMKRWAKQFHDLDLSHYAVSIVRGRGIDAVALDYLAAHHDAGSVVFVDGWTGKGAIGRELTAALEEHHSTTGIAFSDQLAVLADPASCTDTFGTRDDFLIASACLNSTVSGLISRTVLNDQLIGPGEFHGAKFYSELSDVDDSNYFLQQVEAVFDEAANQIADDQPLSSKDRQPTWQGWKEVERLSADYGIGDVNLIKPGVGETTRVLLRRVPWKILVNPAARKDLDHVRFLAEERGVPVEQVEGLSYSCVGLIHPNFTAGAVGSDGLTAKQTRS